jgi:hypothetical protein
LQKLVTTDSVNFGIFLSEMDPKPGLPDRRQLFKELLEKHLIDNKPPEGKIPEISDEQIQMAVDMTVELQDQECGREASVDLALLTLYDLHVFIGLFLEIPCF